MISDQKSDVQTHFAVEQFLFRETRLLDDYRWEEWQALFTDDGDYWMPLTADQPDPVNHVSLFYDDQVLMTLRIERFSHPGIFSQQPRSSTCHILSNIQITGDEADKSLDVKSNFIVHMIRGEENRLLSGFNEHSLLIENGEFRIRRKKVILTNAAEPHHSLYVYL